MPTSPESEDDLSATDLENLSPFHPEFKQIVTHAQTPVLYGATLTCQSRINRQKVLETLRDLPYWKEVERVVDVGCGPGEVAKNLVAASLLEHKFYTGIDRESSFIEGALGKNLPAHVTFFCTDIFDYKEGTFDGALLIATLQHLGPIDGVVPKLLRLIKRNGYLFCFDSMPGPPATLTPEVPLIGEMFRQISEENTLGRRNDRCLFELKEKAPQFGLRVLEMSPLEIPVPFQHREDYFRLSFFTSELVRRFYSVHLNQEQFFQQLRFWFANQGTAIIHGFGKLLVQRD